MFKSIKQMITLGAMLGLIIAVMSGVSTSAQAATGPDQTTQKVVIESTSYSEGSASAAVSAETMATIEGATQVLWQVPNHQIKVTKKELRKAPHIKVIATGSNSSKVIYKKAKGAYIVVLKKGSKVRNTGKYNQHRVGFVWTLKHDAVLVLDKKSRQYRHAFDLIGGKLVKSCLNFIGGKLPMMKKVVQVRYAGDIQKDVTIKASANGQATANGRLECASGTLTGSASASASASGTVTIRVKMKNRIEAINVAKMNLLSKVKAQAKINAQAKAGAKVSLQCNDTPTTPTTPAPQLLEIDTINDVLVNNTRNITVTGGTAPGHTGTLYCSAGTGTVIEGKSQSVKGDFAAKLTYKAGDEAGTDQVSCTLTQDDGQVAKISTNRFEIRQRPTTPA